MARTKKDPSGTSSGKPTASTVAKPKSKTTKSTTTKQSIGSAAKSKSKSTTMNSKTTTASKGRKEKTEPSTIPPYVENGDFGNERRSSDRRKVAVDRYGLDLFFIRSTPKPEPSSTDPTIAAASTSAAANALAAKLNASSSKMLHPSTSSSKSPAKSSSKKPTTSSGSSTAAKPKKSVKIMEPATTPKEKKTKKEPYSVSSSKTKPKKEKKSSTNNNNEKKESSSSKKDKNETSSATSKESTSKSVADQSTSEKSMKGKPPGKKSDVVKKQRSTKPSEDGPKSKKKKVVDDQSKKEEPSTSSAATAPPALSRTISSVVNAVSSKYFDRKDEDDEGADVELAVDDGRVKIPPPKARKRKDVDDSSANDSPETKKIKKTIDDMVIHVMTQADSESDEGKVKTTTIQQAAGNATAKKKSKDRSLNPRPNVRQYFHEPTFESRDELPFISVTAYSKLAVRAVLINNESLLKRLIDDVEHVSDVKLKRSVDVPYDAAAYALFNGNSKLLQMIIDDEKKPKLGRVEPIRNLLGQQSTGQFNFHMLGHAVRKLEMSRGAKEGVNALNKDQEGANRGWNERLNSAMQLNAPFQLIQQMILQNVLDSSTVAQRIYEAVRYGNHKLAGAIMNEYGGSWFNDLHRQVLSNTNEPLKPFKPISIKKKGNMNQDITPFHCACINPNEKYLQALMAVEFDYNHPDKSGFRPIHYAAACSSSGPLKLLMHKGAQPSDMVKGENALHRACIAGRAHNVDAILQHCRAADPDLVIVKQKSRFGYAPLHLAAKNGHLECVRALCARGGESLDVDLVSSAGKNSMTAVMFAAQQGHLAIVEYLINEMGASASKADKMKRTALVHAVMNGMAHVASFLLRWGVDPDAHDSSGNTPTHYAAAYGWYFCLKLLIESGAKLNENNDWQLTPLAVAYMKGHMGLADVLLQLPGIDINCRNDQGMTLVASTLYGTVDDSTLDQLNYLIKQKGADPTPTDAAGNTPLHLLAAANLKAKPKKKESHEDANGRLSIEIAKLLIEKGVNTDVENEHQSTAMNVAVEAGNLRLAYYLAESGSKLSAVSEVATNKPNLVHCLIALEAKSAAKHRDQSVVEQQQQEAKDPDRSEALEMLNLLLRNHRQEVVDRLSLVDAQGCTPFLLAVSLYAALKEYDDEANREDAERVKRRLLAFVGALLKAAPEIVLQRSKKVEKPLGPSVLDEEEQEEVEDEDEDEEAEEEKDEETEKSDEDDDDEDSEAAEERKRAEKERKKKQKLELDEGRSALHLLAGSKIVRESTASTPDPLLDLLTNHIKSNKNAVDCSKTRLLDAVDGRGETSLFAAIKNRRSNMALQMIELGCNVNCVRRLPPSMRPKTPPKVDASKDEEDGRRSTSMKKSPTYAPDRMTALMEAVRVQSTQVFEKLLKSGADVHAAESDGNTALHYACTSTPSNVAIVRQLLEAGANFEARNGKLRTPLHLACNADSGATDVSTETLACLLNYGADPFVKDVRNRLPLHYAFVKIGKYDDVSSMDPVALCTVLLPRMAGQPQSLNAADSFGCTPLHCAARRGSNICCMTLLRHTQVDRNAKDTNGNTPLAMAVLHDHMACALTLLQAEADVNVNVKFESKDKKEDSDDSVEPTLKWAPMKKPRAETRILSLSSAVVDREWQGVVYLLIDIFNKRKQSLHALLEAAVEHRKYNLSLTLLRMAKSQPGSVSQAPQQRTTATGKKNLFHLLADNERPSGAAAVQLQLDVATAIVEFGNVSIDEHRDDPSGPFHPAFYAAKRRNVPLLRFILDKTTTSGGASGGKNRSIGQYAISSSGHSILTMFMWTVGDQEMTTDECALIEDLRTKYGLTLDVHCRYPVPVDCTATDSRFYGYWTSDQKDEQLVTPLIHAIHGRSFNAVKSLLKAGADPNFADAKGMTPSMHAARLNEPDIIKVLLNFDYVRSRDEPKHEVHDMFRRPDDAYLFQGADDEDDEDEDEDDHDEDEAGDDDGNPGANAGTSQAAMAPMVIRGLGGVKAPRVQLATRAPRVQLATKTARPSAPHVGRPGIPKPVRRVFNIDGEAPAMPTSQYSAAQVDVNAEVEAHDSDQPEASTTPKKRPHDSPAKFKKTSVVDLSMVDANERNVLHHLISTTDAGGWTGTTDILQILINAGADPKKKDRNGLTPLDYAKKNGQIAYAEILGEKIDDVAKKIDPKSSACKKDDGRAAVEKATGKSINVEQDAKEYLIKLRRQKEEEETKKVGKVDSKLARRLRPHRSSGYEEIGEIVMDTSGGGEKKQDEGEAAAGAGAEAAPAAAVEPVPFDVLLNRVDFQYGLYGYYNFYRMQLIRRKGSDLYVLFTNWGRIGDDGQFQKTPFPKLADAVKEFKSIFRAKTGNDWSPEVAKKFEEHPKKYRLINKEDDEKLEESSTAADVPIVLETSLASMLPVHLQRFMDDVADVKQLTMGAKRIFRNSRFDLTVTALKRDAVLKADAILNEIGEKLKKLDTLRKDAHDKEKLEEAMKLYHDLATLSTEFYFLLPLRGFERSRLPMIDDLTKWSENKSAVEQLLKYEIANQLLCAAAGRRTEIHPYDYIYTAIGTRMEQLTDADQETQMILHYIQNTTPDEKRVVAVYKLWNEERSKRYAEMAERVGNRWLMWHGTRATNVLSILESGLMIAPPQALHSGHLFGKGVYVADSFEKSAAYCEASSNGRKFAFLCEVALGKIARLWNLNNIDTSVDPLPSGYDSVQGLGNRVPNPLHDFALKDGTKIPLGERIRQVPGFKTHNEFWLDQNEFIVYNPNQVSLRYMIVFK